MKEQPDLRLIRPVQETFESFCNRHGVWYHAQNGEESALMQIGDLLIEVTGDRPDWTVTVWSIADGSRLLDEWYDVYYHARGDLWAEQRRSIQSLIELLSRAQIRVVEGPEHRLLGSSFSKPNILQHKHAEDWVQFNAFYDFFD